MRIEYTNDAGSHLNRETTVDPVVAHQHACEYPGRSVRLFLHELDKADYIQQLHDNLQKYVDADESKDIFRKKYMFGVRFFGIQCKTKTSESLAPIDSVVEQEVIPVTFSEDRETCYVQDISAVPAPVAEQPEKELSREPMVIEETSVEQEPKMKSKKPKVIDPYVEMEARLRSAAKDIDGKSEDGYGLEFG